MDKNWQTLHMLMTLSATLLAQPIGAQSWPTSSEWWNQGNTAKGMFEQKGQNPSADETIQQRDVDQELQQSEIDKKLQQSDIDQELQQENIERKVHQSDDKI